MKKSILKNLMILSFALGALVLVRNNVFAEQGTIGDLKPIGRYCTYGMQSTGDWNDVAVMCSNCHPLFGYRSFGDSGTC